MMKKLLLFFMMLAMAVPLWAGEKTVTISRNDISQLGVYYCDKGGVTMTFSSGMNNPNYLVEHQQVVFYIRSNNYVIKKIVFHCLDNTTENDLDAFYWGPSTISEEGEVGSYTPTGTYTYTPGGYIGTWVAGSVDSKNVAFTTKGRPVRFGSVEITYDKDTGDIFDLVTSMNQIAVGQKYVIVSQRASKAMSTHTVDGLSENNIPKTTMGSTSVSFVDDTKQKVIVNEDVMILSLESNPSSVSNTMRPYLFKYGNQYLRRNSATSGSDASASNYTYGHNLSLASYETATDKMYFPFNISFGTNSNAMMSFIQRGATLESESTSGSYSIRYHNGSDFFRVLNWTTSNTYAANQRVYLYRPAQNYVITTQCLPDDNSGYITLGDGVLELNGQQTSQQYQNVSFFVGPTEGWGVGAVTVTNLSTNEVTTLTPTNTSDFGNDYSFEMPAGNVNITANFLQPFNIDTICNPSDGGQFNFINGYTNFSGQYYSNEGKTVTFKPTAAEGYIFNSVTYTDNVTGETTTLTPDADGVYSFVMPGNDVTLTANFEEANDLYLLGTANGRTSWIPSGPKFTFDGQKYYIDVYFKGGNDDPQTDPAYGYFSLTKKIDEGGNWNNIQGYRLAAVDNNTWVEDGYTGVRLYDDRPNNAFKIPPGVYRIEVNAEMTEMSIIEYPLTVTFDPASGTVVESGDVVNFTSNLNDLVHGINSQEVQATYNSYDNWGVTTSDDTHTITHDGITTVTGQSKIGYITATGTADYEIVGDLYLLGTANGMDSWQPYGPKFTYDATTETYSLDVYFTGLNVTAADAGYGYFSLSSVISDPNNPNWSDIPNSARYNAEYNDEPITGLNYNESVTEELYQTDPNWCFKIDPGVYTITVKKDKSEMTVTKHELTLSFNPPSGTTVAAGDPVNIYSNLEQVVHAINPDEPLHATIEYATSTDGSLPTPDTAGSTVNITAVGATTTVNALAALGYIVVSGNAYYTVPAPEVYDIFTIVDPEEAGTITAPSGDIAGATVNFTVTDADPSLFTLLGVEVVDGNNAIVETFEPSADGNYSFTMPDDEVTIYADYVRTPYNVTTSWSPSEGGAIWLNGVNTPQTVSVPNADQVVFGVAPADGYLLSSLIVTNTATGQEITTTPTGGSNEYTFVMPASNVTVTANFSIANYQIFTENTPALGGIVKVSGQVATIDNNNYSYGGANVIVTPSPYCGWELSSLTVSDANGTYINVTYNGDGTYSFTMPEANATVHAGYKRVVGDLFELVTDEKEIVADQTYVIVAGSYGNNLNGKVMTHKQPEDISYSFTDVVERFTDERRTVRVDDRACMFKMDNLNDTTFTGHTRKAAWLNTLNGYISDSKNGDGYLTNSPTRDEYGRAVLLIYGEDGISYNRLRSWFRKGHSENFIYPTISYDVDSTQVLVIKAIGPVKQAVYLYKLAPYYNILTECDPEGAGFITLGSSAVDGKSQQLSTIQFHVGAVHGYHIQQVTVTNNTTGETVELTTENVSYDGNDYSFVMPASDVTIRAEFYVAEEPDLYLLGTVMSRDSWCASGPRFNYDLVNNQYVLDVYFKGKGEHETSNPSNDPYGYFWLATGVDSNITWQTADENAGDWNQVTGRLVAVENLTLVQGGDTEIQLYGNRPDNAFKIPAGVYRITVDRDLTKMSIVKTPLHLTFNPVTGTYVLPGQEVIIGSDLETIVHDIASQHDINNELSQSFMNKIFGSGTKEYDNTAVITENGSTIVQAEAWIGHIVADGEAEYTIGAPTGHNITTVCDPAQGGTITLEGTAADEYEFEGRTVTLTVDANLGFTFGSLTVVLDGTTTQIDVTDNGDGTYSFTMPEGDVTVTAHYELEGVIFKLVTDPSEIVEGEYYTIINKGYDRVLNNIAPDAVTNFYSSTNIVEWASPDKSLVKLDGNACFFSPEDVTDYNPSSYTLYRSGYLKTSGGYIGREPNVENNEYGHLALFGSKDNVKPFYMSVDTYGAGSSDHWAYIHYDFDSSSGSVYDSWEVFFDKFEDNTYFEYNSFLLENTTLTHYDTWLYKPAKMYNITTVVNPDGTESSLELYGGAVGNTGAEGSTIVVWPVAAEGEALYSLEVTVDDTGDVVEVTPNVDGSYTFVMPSNDVTITATFTTGYHISWVCDPENTGEIIVTPTAYAGQHVAFEVLPCDGYEVTGITVTKDGDQDEISFTENEDGTYSFNMPDDHVTIKATLVLHSEEATLQYIEKWDTYESGTRVTVNDELIGTWMAKQYLWAKDQYPQRSNVYLERDVDVDPYDFIRNSLKREVDDNYFIPWQPDEWDQSNWVMLDFSQILGFADWEENAESYLAMREAMQTFVDNKIEAGTITGRYLCLGEPVDDEEAPGDYPKVQHIIVLEKLPEVVEPVTTPQTTLGYPGYVQDPKEWRGRFYDDPSKYSYNHYMSYNFNKDNTIASGTQLNEDALDYWHEQGIELDPDTRYFFMNPKDQEVAQVCGVWVGQKQFEFNGETILGDVFDSYAFSPEEGVNQLGFYGAFYVPSRVSGDDLRGWKFNRLISDNEETNPIYGMPGIDDGKGLNGELKVGEAYIFHAAIQYPYVPFDEPSKAPLRDLEPYGSDPEFYTVYPLDLMSPVDAFTAVSEVKSQESTEIDSIRYYNIMGQESDVPFDGINIRVIRYKDGSMISKKILK